MNPNQKNWGPWEDYYRREKTRLLHLAQENRRSLFKIGFGVPEPQGVKSEPVIRYAQREIWTPTVFEHNKVVPHGENSGYRCLLCYFDADKNTMMEHVLEKEHLHRASKSPDGIWADPSQSTTAVPSGAASGSSTTQPWPNWSDVAAIETLVAQETHPWGHMVSAGSAAQPSMTPTRPQAQTWQPTTVDSGLVQKLTDMPEAMRLAQAPTIGAAKLTIVDMALQFPDQGVVIPGSSQIAG